MKGGEFVDQLRDYELLKKVCTYRISTFDVQDGAHAK
jgi:hypothetical protein